MSTNAIIKVEGLKCVLYKHWDGYPQATLQWLIDFNKDFEENRKDDPNYKFAQLIRSSARDAEKYGLDQSIHTGWGVYESMDDITGQEFVYTLKNDGSVVYKSYEEKYSGGD